MRWPWQRKPAPVASIAPARPRSDWRRVGTLRPTADVHAPTMVPTGLPVLASTRSLLYRERAESSVAPAGRVTGLALVSPVAQADPVAIVAPPVRTTVTARPVRSTLTRAVAEYVGEARVPAVPHRAPAWLRNAPPQVLTPLDAFAMPETSLPEIAVLDSWTTKPPALDRETPELVEEEPVTPRPAPQIRRRRPGLGLPLPPGERPPMPTQKFPAQKFPEQKFPEQQLPAEQMPTQQMQSQNMQVQQFPTQNLPAQQPMPGERPGPPMIVDAPALTAPEAPKLVHPTVVPGRFSARVPADLAETFERAYGVEVADVAIDRSPAATAQARAMGAKAFAHHDLIVLPDEVGPIEAVEARALLGHELAHVVQQRTIGSVPTESGSDGQHLEAAARAVEQWVRAGASGPPPPVVPRSSERSGPPPVRRRANAGPPSSAGAPQRAPAGVATDPAAPQAPRVVTSTSAATTSGATLVHPATQPTARPDDHDPLNPRDHHEYGALVKGSFAHLGLDMFGIGGLMQHQAPPSPTTSSGQSQVSQPATGASFNRDARRQQLTEDTLQRINLVRAQQGEPATSELPETELAAIEMQLDAEQGGSGGQSSALPVIHNASELKEQIRLGGGELLGAFIGYNPVEHQKPEAETPAHQQTSTTNGTGGAGAPGATQPSAAPGAHPDQPAAEPTGTELARLYDRIHTRLLRELLVGRERAGVLMDFR
jgi:hypothetical protein